MTEGHTGAAQRVKFIPNQPVVRLYEAGKPYRASVAVMPQIKQSRGSMEVQARVEAINSWDGDPGVTSVSLAVGSGIMLTGTFTTVEI